MRYLSNRYFTRLFLLLSLFLIPVFSFCWGKTGHRVVGEIAQHHLTAKAKKELIKLMRKESLAVWSNWADFIKSDTSHTWDMASKWHYINLPGDLNHDEFIEALRKSTGENLYTQLKSMIAQVKDKSLSQKKRQIALKFLIHFTGDLHQPLHIGREADQGGNKIEVTWFDKSTNLHAVWDNFLVESEQYSYTEFANILDIAGEDEIKKWQSSSLEEWFYDSYVLANKVYANVPEDGKLSYRYIYLFQKDMETQLLKGGLRLAKILNDILD
jgi:hypothetical protein